jgi:two-component system response regulator NreC
MERIRVVIADDHAVVRAGLRLLIEAQPDLEVVGEAADGAATLRAVRAATPDVVVLDFTMPDSRGTQTIEALARLHPSPRVLVLTMHDDRVYALAALAAGADGYVAKKAADIELLTAIRAVYHGRTVVDLTRPGALVSGRDEGRAIRGTPPNALPRPLSPQEAKVIRLLAEGHTYREVAVRLDVSVKTVETYRKRLTEKLGLKTRSDLFRFASESGLLEDDAAPG